MYRCVNVVCCLVVFLTHLSVLLLCRQPSVPGGLGAFATKNFKR